MLNLPITLTITADALAWYGAIVATFSAALSGLNYFRDREGVHIKLAQGFAAYPLATVFVFLLEAANHGRRSVTLVEVGFLLESGEKIVIIRPETISFPYELHEGKSISIPIEKKEVLEEAQKRKTTIKNMYFRSATNKIYKTRVSKLILSEQREF